MVLLVDILENVRIQIFLYHDISVAFHILQSIKLLPEFLFDDWNHFQHALEVFGLYAHNSSVLVKFFTVNV